ncbi:MAG: putative bifunctional diguanylate cyclase/phosphodiesterase [Lachnospiraceae bacterium]
MNDLQFQLDMAQSVIQHLDSKEKMYQLVCSTSRNAFIYVDFSKKSLSVLGNWSSFFDFMISNESELIKIIEAVEDDYRNDLQKLLFFERTQKENDSLECKLEGKDKWLEFECTIIYQDGSPIEKVIRIRDISKFKKQNEELQYMAYYDTLTGLFNRNYFVRVLSEWIRNAESDNESIAVMCLDFDHFKKINDGLGLVAGDELVQSFGLFLKDMLDDRMIAAHFNDDTFYMAIKNPVGNHSVDYVFDHVLKRLEKPFRLLGGHEIYITLCAGVAEYPETATNSLELINCAEVVMFRAKELGTNQLKYFEAPIYKDFLENVNLENRLKEAISMNRFVLYYQPQYDSKSGDLRGVEALIRWKDENGKMISPGCFIPLAEKSGLIVPIGSWVLEEGIKKYAEWRKKYDCNMVLSLNISALQYKRQDFVNNLFDLLEKYQVNPKGIELEITESVLIDDFEQVVEKLHVIKDYGIKISLDDFGTGFSSLSYLKGLPIDTLKIDKSFIDTVIDDESTQVIAESIVSMVKKLGYETVAEGVETKEQFEYLKKIECDNIQGFLLGKPMPEEELVSLMEHNG